MTRFGPGPHRRAGGQTGSFPYAESPRSSRPGAAPYGFYGADFDSLMARLLVFDPSRLFLGAAAALPPLFCIGRTEFIPARPGDLFVFSPLPTPKLAPTLALSQLHRSSDCFAPVAQKTPSRP